MVNWSTGYSARYYASIVDPTSWRDISTFDITGGSVSREDSDLRQSADIDTVGFDLQGEKWVRIWMNARQGDNGSHVALFTGLATSPSVDIDGTLVSNKLQCYSVLKPLQDILLSRGWYVNKGVICVTIIRDLVRVLDAPVTIMPSNEARFSDYIVAENNETYLSMLDKVLDAMGWRLVINGMGEITIGPFSDDEISRYDSISNDILEPSLQIESDWYGCPNVLRVIDSQGNEYTVRDDDKSHPYSIPSRGREVWAEESNANIPDGSSIRLYAENRLAELQQYSYKVNYTRRFDPKPNVTDVIRINYPAQKLSGLFYIVSQSITLGYNASTSEEVVKV